MSGFLILAKNANTIKEVWDQMTKDNNDETIEKRKRSRLYGRHMEDIPPTPARVGKSCGLPQRVSIIMHSAPVSLSVAEQHGWNWEDKSFNIIVKANCLVMKRLPIAQSTDCIRTRRGYTSGIHKWEVTWPAIQRGTHAVVGVGTSQAPLHLGGYQSLLGNSTTSWGWDLGSLQTFHNNQLTSSPLYPSTVTHQDQWHVPDIFTMILDMDNGTLGFAVGDQFLGWAHHELNSQGRLYPMVSTVFGECEIKLRYMGGLTTITLKEIASDVIKAQLGRNGERLQEKVDCLELPISLKEYLLQ